MKKFIVLTSLSLLPYVSQAAGNRNIHCRSKSAELVFHTVMHGALAIGDYTVLNGQRVDLPYEGQSAEGTLTFYNHGRVFEVEDAGSDAPLQFKLLRLLFGADTILIETGICEEE